MSAAAAAALFGLALPGAAAEPPSDVLVRRLSGAVYLHTSTHGPLSANGLIVGAREGSLLVNTAPTVGQTEKILAWAAANLPRAVRLAIITEADEASMGGLDALIDAQVPVHASERTAERARVRALGWTRDHFSFENEQRIRAGDYSLQLFFPGGGPAPDNLVVWIPEEQVLFGGGLVRSARESRLSALEPDVVAGWAEALRRTRDRYPEARWVVPGMGDAGSAQLLEHTLDLLERAGRR